MKSFLLIFLCWSVAAAAPAPALQGYGYQQPGIAINNPANQFYYKSNNEPAGSGQVSSINYPVFLNNNNQQQLQPNVFQQHYHNQYQQPQQQFQNHYQPQSHHVAAPIITKNFYIHSAPEESDSEIQQDLNSYGAHRRHFNVVFIKAPTHSARTSTLALAQALNEEKTVIYVLSKKSDISEIRSAIQEAPVHNSKPEVFFIKYKTPEEAQHAQNQIQAQYDALGGSSQVSDEGFAPSTSVIGALGNEESNAGVGSASVFNGNGNNIQLGPIQNSAAYLPPRKI